MIEIIPSIDVLNGQVVRLRQGDFSEETRYSRNPLDVAKKFEKKGASRLHLVDLDGAREGRIMNYHLLERIAKQTKLKIDFGGGIKSDKDIRIAFNSGANMVTAGTIAVSSKDVVLKWLSIFGAERIVLGADTRDGKIAVNGWRDGTPLDVVDFIREYLEAGIKKVICTAIEKDGMLDGPAIDLYKRILIECEGIQLIASGGITSQADILSLNEAGLSGAIIGKAIYEGKFKLKQLFKEYAVS
ncbi:MAG: 1-(5-phosphoribosyl)-5-[(5-phosphoribosylamino)methylideneamino]imidazole-4-carboxamide isomerase [Bacteroidales bacterium]|nr:1-(5-phosphoribosyl)-5-[(5-phosphoribosylamino)methylideneamino]imidazole-4-carboxamide isomerase [Bacteroidales bacterium]